MSSTLFSLAADTNVGLVRSNNEDNFIVCADLSSNEWELPNSLEEISLGEFGCLLVVADGMGGMNAGEVASSIAIESVRKSFANAKLEKIIHKNRFESFLKHVVTIADQDIKTQASLDSSHSGMGTTIVIAWIQQNLVHVCWCGDSRAYIIDKISGILRLSKDHSYVQQLVDENKLDEELAFDHPDSNIITRSLGDFNQKAKPDYVVRPYSEGDTIVLCSDGLCGYCRDSEIADIVLNTSTASDICNGLISAALKAGGYDNVTVSVYKCLSQEEGNDISQTIKSFGKTDNIFKKVKSLIEKL